MKGQTKPDEFIWIFFAGMLAIVIMLFFWGTPNVELNQTENTSSKIGEVFTIGSFDEEVPRVIRIGDFYVSNTAGSQILETKKYFDVSKSLFDNKKYSFSVELSENMENVVDGWINIYVLEGGAGRLVIKINNNVVFNQVANPGKIMVPVSKNYLTNYNIIEVSSGMPGLMFWSTSTYKIEKIQFGINIYGSLTKKYDFNLYGSELKTFTKGEIKFNLEERNGPGDLIIKINGRKTFKGIPSGNFNHEFEVFDVGLVNGVNSIEFSTERDTSYKLDDVEIVITHKEKSVKSRTFSFFVSDSDMDKLQKGKKGRISFVILDSDYNSNLYLKIKDSEGNEHNLDYVSSYSIGKNINVYFGPNDVKVGTNYLQFSVVGEGRFTLSNLEIII